METVNNEWEELSSGLSCKYNEYPGVSRPAYSTGMKVTEWAGIATAPFLTRAFSAPGLTAVVFWATASKPADRDTAKRDMILLTIVDEVIVLEKPKKRLARRASLL